MAAPSWNKEREGTVLSLPLEGGCYWRRCLRVITPPLRGSLRYKGVARRGAGGGGTVSVVALGPDRASSLPGPPTKTGYACFGPPRYALPLKGGVMRRGHLCWPELPRKGGVISQRKKIQQSVDIGREGGIMPNPNSGKEAHMPTADSLFAANPTQRR